MVSTHSMASPAQPHRQPDLHPVEIARGPAPVVFAVPAEVIAEDVFAAQDDLGGPARLPEPANPGAVGDKVVEIIPPHIPAEVFDEVGIEGEGGPDLEDAQAFVGLAITQPA